MNLGFGKTGSFCTFERIKTEIQTLRDKGYNILPIFSYVVSNTDTRFGRASDFEAEITKITGIVPIKTIVEAEPLGPSNKIDVLVIAPCTGNTLAKLANSISDTPVTMAAKAHLRNNKPLVIAISTNDALGQNLKNVAALLNTKNVYFVPFRQDDAIKKPKSLVAEYILIEETVQEALKGQQIQPIMLAGE